MIEKRVNQKAWFMVLPVFLIVAFSAIIPLMTVVNYSVQDTFGNNVFFWVGFDWFRDLIHSERFHEAFLRQLLFSGIILAIELVVVVGGSTLSPEIAANASMPIPPVAERQNTAALGDVLYTHYVYYFQIAGLVLLVAMIGAIVLTLRHKPHIKRQNISQQVARTPETAVEVVKVKPGQGI